MLNHLMNLCSLRLCCDSFFDSGLNMHVDVSMSNWQLSLVSLSEFMEMMTGD